MNIYNIETKRYAYLKGLRAIKYSYVESSMSEWLLKKGFILNHLNISVSVLQKGRNILNKI